MKTKITISTLLCCVSMWAVADNVGNATDSVSGPGVITPGVPPVTTIPLTSAPPATNYPPGSVQPMTNSAPGFNPSSSNDAAGYIPPGYQKP